MKIDLAALFGDAWRMFRRDRDVLLPVAGLFIFLPQLAVMLLVPPSPEMPAGSDAQAASAWIDAMVNWYSAHGVPLLAADLAALWGGLTIVVSYLDRTRPDLAGALQTALLLLPRYILATLLETLMVFVGLALFLLPGLYLQGRFLLVGSAIVAERPLGAVASLGRSFALTRGNGLILGVLAAAMLFGGSLLASPFLALGDTLDRAPIANPISAALLSAAASAVLAAVALATVLLRVALYRRLTSNGI